MYLNRCFCMNGEFDDNNLDSADRESLLEVTVDRVSGVEMRLENLTEL